MSRSYLPEPDDARAIWLTHFAQALLNFLGQCTITGQDQENTQKDADFWAFLVGLQAEVQRTAEGVTAYKNQMRDGLPRGVTGTSTALPDLPAYSPAPNLPPAAVAYGIFQRARDLAARIKRAPDYVDSIGQALGIESPDTPAKRPEDMLPTVALRGSNAGHPVLRVGRDGAPQVEVLADRGDGHWVLLTITTRAELTDPAPLPPAGTAQVWRYQAICHDGSGRIGQMSEVLSVTVRGM